MRDHNKLSALHRGIKQNGFDFFGIELLPIKQIN